MPLEWTKVTLRPLGGIDEHEDKLELAPPGALGMRNLYHEDKSKLSKRPGFSLVNPTDLLLEDPKALASMGHELVAIGETRLWSWNEDIEQFLERDTCPAATLKVDQLRRSERQSASSDVAIIERVGNLPFLVEVGHVFENLATLSTEEHRIFMTVKTLDGTVIISDHVLDEKPGFAGTDTIHSPKVINVNGTAVITWQQGHNTATPAIKATTWSSAAPTTLPAAATTLQTNMANLPAELSYCVYDTVSDGTTWWLGWVDSVADLKATKYNTALAVQSTVSDSSLSWRACALGYDSVNDEVLWVGCTQSAGTENLILNTINVDTPAVAQGPLTVGAFVSPVRMGCFGISNYDGTVNSLDYYTVMFTSTSPGAFTDQTYWRNIDISAFTAGGTNTANHCHLAVRPFQQFPVDHAESFAGDVYAPMTYQAATAYGSNFVFDLGPGDNISVDNQTPKLAGMWAFGEALQDDIAFQGYTTGRLGAVNHETRNGREVIWAHPVVGAVENGGVRIDQQLVRMDFDGRPSILRSSRNGAVVAGCFVGWYDGVDCDELGFVGVPIPVSVTDVAGASIPAQDVSYIAHWRETDALGLVHRGIPGPTIEHTISENTDVEVEWKYHPCARRGRGFSTSRIKLDTKVEIYTAGTVAPRDTFYRRLTKPGRVNANIPYFTTADLTFEDDENTALGAIIYTVDGTDLEAAPLNACNFVAYAGERVWATGFAQADRVQYSDRIVGNQVGDQYAPEFNPSLSIAVPDGQRATGLVEVGDKVVLFTERNTYLIAGDGPGLDGSNNDISKLIQVSLDYGCVNRHSIVKFPGGVFFESNTGLCMVDDRMQVQYVGNYEESLGGTLSIVDADAVPSLHQVRFLLQDSASTNVTVLVYDWVQKAFHDWSITSASRPVASATHDNLWYFITQDGKLYKEDRTSSLDVTDTQYTFLYETPWIAMGQQNGWQKLRYIFINGSRAGNDLYGMKVTISYDYDETDTEVITITPTKMASQPSGFIKLKLHPAKKRCAAFKVKIEDDSVTSTDGVSFTIRSINLELGSKAGTQKTAASEKQ